MFDQIVTANPLRRVVQVYEIELNSSPKNRFKLVGTVYVTGFAASAPTMIFGGEK